jgi:hypothetical protein
VDSPPSPSLGPLAAERPIVGRRDEGIIWMRLWTRLYAVCAAAILALGVLHMATTFRLSSFTPAGKVWFFGSGIALALMGVLNLLNRRYGYVAPGLRAACIACNFVLLCFAVVAGRLTGATLVEQVVLTAVLLSALILSAVPSASVMERAA